MNFDQQRAPSRNTEKAFDGLGLSEANLHIIDAIPSPMITGDTIYVDGGSKL
jgi:hypothetical protein